MSIHKRPFTGTWTKTVQNKELRRHVPDVIVKFNGETDYPACAGCSGRIDLQDLITSVSVSNSTDTSPANVSLSMSIPTNRYACLFRDNKFVLHAGIEIHVYMRGYFSTQELVLQSEETLDANTPESQIPMKPYYQVFHGVVTQTQFSFSGGFYECSMTANDLFHFWQYQNINTNPSVLGSKVSGSKVKINFTGSKYTRRNAYNVIFDLYSSKHGDAGAQDFVLSDFTNIGIKSDLYQDSFWDTAGWYWAKRFEQPMNKLKMYGADGRQFTTLEQLAVADPHLVDKFGSQNAKSWLEMGTRGPTNTLIYKVNAILRNADETSTYAFPVSSLFYVQQSAFARFKENGGVTSQGLRGNNVASQTAFALDLGSLGSVNIFEAQTTTKMDIASTVCTESGFEFFIDMNGDYVFKPPLYNLDTSDSRVYTIKAIDLISFDNTESEPAATVMKGTGGYYANWGSLLPSEYENRGMYVDWKLVAKYGWREADFQTTFFTDPKSIYYACINRLYLENKEVQSGSVSIPLRPEMKLGFPVYIEPFDCFYYVNSISHSFSFGGECTTDLGLIAKRAKFFPPMRYHEGSVPNLEDIDFENIYRTSRPLYTRTKEGFPQLMGFPNVVMALDVSLLNPLWFSSGEISVDLLGAALNTKNVSAGGKGGQEQVRVFLQTMAKDGYCTITKESNVIFYDNYGSPATKPLGLSDVNQLFARLFVATSRASKSKSNWERGEFNSYVDLYKSDPQFFNDAISKSEGSIDYELFVSGSTETEQAVVSNAYTQSLSQDNETFEIFIRALDAFRKQNLDTAFGQDRTPIQNYLDALTFMKSSFRPDDMQPGSYRYYSDAFPNTIPNHPTLQSQGQAIQDYVYDGGDISINTTVIASKPLEFPLQTTKVLDNGDGTFRISSPNKDPNVDGTDPIYETKYGIEVLVPQGTPDAKQARTARDEYSKVVPTSKITTIMFSIPRQDRNPERIAEILIPNQSLIETGEDGLNSLKTVFFDFIGNDIPMFSQGLNTENFFGKCRDLLNAMETLFIGSLELQPLFFPNDEEIFRLDLYVPAYTTLSGVEKLEYTGIYLDSDGNRQTGTVLIGDMAFNKDVLFRESYSEDKDIANAENAVFQVFYAVVGAIKDLYEKLLKSGYTLLVKELKTLLMVKASEDSKKYTEALVVFNELKDIFFQEILIFWSNFILDNDLIISDPEILAYMLSDQTAPEPTEIFTKTERELGRGEFYYSPVFPVSDNKGFEHFGSYAYGRDYNIKTFTEALSATPDFWANLNPEQMVDFLVNLANNFNSEDAAYQTYLSGNLSPETRIALTNILVDRLNESGSPTELPEALKASYDNRTLTGETVLEYIEEAQGNEEEIAKIFNLQFRNDITKLTREYGAEYEIATENTPISLAQLDTQYAPFQCSGAAGSLALDKSFGFMVTNDTRNIANGLDIASFVQDQTATSLVDWNLRQEALRGNPNPNNSAGATLAGLQSAGFDDPINNVVEFAEQAVEDYNVLGEDIDNSIADAISQFNEIDEEDN